MTITDLIQWFTGGSQHQYMPLWHCLDRDTLWVAITITVDVLIASGYCLIAYHWNVNQQRLAPSPARRALGNMRNIFVFCGLCGYGFIPVKMIWPAWRLYDLFMVVLVYFTWRYAWGARDLKVIYSEMHRTRRLEADLLESRAESEQKSFFLNAISHDLRTPLNGMALQADVAQLSLESGDSEGAQQAIRQILGSARSAATLLDHLMEIGRLDWHADPIHNETFHIIDLLASVAGMYEDDARRKGIELRVEADPDLTVTCDRLKLQRIVMNLVQNAVKFTTTGHVLVRAGCEGAQMQLDVEDTGEGIAEEHHARLFQEFFQVRNRERDRRKGFGLGLAIADRLVRQLGGRIAVNSAVGRGSCFTVRIPQCQQQPISPAEPVPVGPATGAGGGG